MADSLTDIATRQQVLLERLKQGFTEQWEPLQGELRTAVAEIFARRVGVGNLRELSTVELNKLLVDLGKAHAKYANPFVKNFSQELKALARMAVRNEAAALPVAAVPSAATVSGANAFKAAQNLRIQAVGQTLARLLETWSAVDVERLQSVVRTGWDQGQTLAAMTRSLVGTKKQNFTDGELERTKRNVAAVVHTATQHVANTARHEVWKANDEVKGYKWVATLDRRTTPVCRSLDELDKIYKVGVGPLPPIHVRCRSTTKPWLGKRYEFLEQGATRASSSGPVDGSLTYYEWLKLQSPEFQNLALGPTRAKLFREGGLTSKQFAALQLDKNFRPLTLAQMEKIAPEAFAKAFGFALPPSASREFVRPAPGFLGFEKRRVTGADLRNADVKKAKGSELSLAQTEKRMQETFGLSLLDYKGHIEKVIGDTFSLSVSGEKQTGNVVLQLRGNGWKADRILGKAGDALVAWHSDFKVGDQGKGFGRLFLNATQDIYDNIGVEKISLLANASVGGYAWARYGFLPEPAAWTSLQSAMRRTLSTIVDETERAELSAFVESDDVRAIRNIASHPRGRDMLLTKGWFGSLDLTNADEYATFKAYLNK